MQLRHPVRAWPLEAHDRDHIAIQLSGLERGGEIRL